MILCIHFYCVLLHNNVKFLVYYEKIIRYFYSNCYCYFGWNNVYASMNKEVKISKMALANVEALARDEGSSGNKCTVISYEDVWSGGCLYYCAKCAEGYYQVIALRHCNAR